MDVYQCIKTRRTVREFKPDPVPQPLIWKILQAGRWAPSSSDSQPWHFIVIQDWNTLAALSEIATQGRFIGQAPLAIAIVMDNAPRPQLYAGRALQQMELMAWSEGVASCFVGLRVAEQRERAMELLGIPQGMELITILPFGYRAEGGSAGKGTPRKPMAQIAHGERFGQPYS